MSTSVDQPRTLIKRRNRSETMVAVIHDLQHKHAIVDINSIKLHRDTTVYTEWVVEYDITHIETNSYRYIARAMKEDLSVVYRNIRPNQNI